MIRAKPWSTANKIRMCPYVCAVALFCGGLQSVIAQAQASKCAGQPAHVDIRKTKQIGPRLSVPKEANAWAITLELLDGLRGPPAPVRANSRGDIRVGRRILTANSKDDVVRGLFSAVAATHPEHWLACNVRPTPRGGTEDGCCDQFLYILLLGRRSQNGKDEIYRVTWYDDDVDMLPADLAKLDKALIKLKSKILGEDLAKPSR